MEKFVHLHNHTEYSLLDGVARIKKLVSLTKERGWDAVAITDHGNMYGTLQFYEECIINDIKPIIGCEFYICENLHDKSSRDETGHLILIAKNNEGYKNLLKLDSIAFVDGFYYKPRIDYKTLKEYAGGLICLSACLAGHIPQAILKRNFDLAKKKALELKEIFDDGDFYIEIQNHGLAEEIEVLPHLAGLAKELGIKLVATNDVHYIEKKDSEMQDVLMCVQMGKTLDDPDRMKFGTDEFYYKTYEEMLLVFQGFEEALSTPFEIAAKCDVVLRTKSLGEVAKVDAKYKMAPTENYIPDYTPDTGESGFDFLKRITFEGLYENYKEVTQDLINRAESELSIIRDQGFVEYFLVVWDYINYARQNGIPVGPGRGSGAGSIVAYCTGITRVDPIKYNLIFERFIHKERVSMPDFDVDFCMDRRGEVIEYVRKKYGKDNVAMIVTFGCMQAKNALRDVARVLRMPYSEVDKITKSIPLKLPDGIKKPPVLKYYFGTTGNPDNDKFIIADLKKIYEEDEFARKIIDMAIKLEGAPRNTSMHAAGVLIAPERVDNYVPLSRNGEDVTTQYNMNELEHLGLLKMDFLGLRTLTDIKKAIDYIKEDKDVDVDFYDMEYDDPKVFELISSGNTDAIFQLESSGMKKFMRDLKPDCMDDIIAGISMYRPGPMDSIPRFVKNKMNPTLVEYAHPCLEPVLNMTYGCIVYQEQVMKVFQVMGGYNMGQADNVRRIMSKKKKELMPIEREKFINGWEDPEGKKSISGAIKLGVSRAVAEKVFAEMESFASYAFNKSHAAAYAYLAYQTAFLRCYHEVEFLAAVLNNRIANADDITKYVTYAKKEKLQVYPPSINKSKTYFSVENGGLRFGLSALKYVGVAVIDLIVNERERGGEFKSFEEFIQRVDSQALNKRCLESLILAGAFDEFGKARSQLMAIYDIALSRVHNDRKNQANGQFSLFDTIEDSSFNKIEYPNIREFNRETILKYEKEYVGVYISGHPLDEYIDKYNDFNLTSDMISPIEKNEIFDINEGDEEEIVYENITDGMAVSCGGIITEVKKLTTKAGNKEMAFLKIEDLYGTLEITLFPKTYSRYKELAVEDNMVTIKGKISLRSGESPSVLVDSICAWKKKEDLESEKTKKAPQTLYLLFDTNNSEILQKVTSSLKSYPGDVPVIVKCSVQKKAFDIKLKVDANNYLINELYGLVGEGNLVLKGE